MTGGCRDSPGHSAHQRGPGLETGYWTPSLPARGTCTATSCWLSVASPSHVELVDRELRAAKTRAIRDWPDGWYRQLMKNHLPAPLPRDTPRGTAVDVHQLRAGHWSGSAQYMHRIRRNPGPDCSQCSEKTCRVGWCMVCKEEADTPRHVLLECPALMGVRLRHLGSIYPKPEEVRSSGVVAAPTEPQR